MSNFKFDLVTLFKLMEERPCLWNKKSQGYKNKILREKNWLEIFYLLDDGFENKDEEEKKKIGDLIQQKWTNVRDAFIRSLRFKRGRIKRKYLYFDHLKFLLSSYELGNMSLNISQISQSEEDSVNAEVSPNIKPSISRQTSTGKKIIRVKRDLGYIKEENIPERKKIRADFVESDSNHSSPVQRKEETFFTSFVPYIMDMSEEEKLELHMEMIKVIIQIKQKRVSSQGASDATITKAD